MKESNFTKEGVGSNEGKESFWKEKKEIIMESLDRRVNVTERFNSLLETITLEQETKEIENVLNNFYTETLSLFSKDTIDKLKDVEILIIEYEEIIQKGRTYLSNDNNKDDRSLELETDLLFEKGVDSEKVDERTALITKKLGLEVKIESSRENLDVDFLLKLRAVINNLVEKNKEIKEILSKEDSSGFAIYSFLSSIKYMNDDDLISIRKENITNVSFEPFNITFDIKKEKAEEKAGEKDKKRKEIIGSYIPRTPFIIIFNRDSMSSELSEIILEHEKRHNLLDGILKEDFTFSELEGYLNFWANLEKKLDASKLNDFKSVIEKVGSSPLIDQEHEEIFLAIEGALNENLRSLYIDYTSGDSFMGYDLRKEGFKELTSIFSTAGDRLMRILEFLEERANREEYKELKDCLLSMGEDLEKKFLRVVEDIRNAIEITDILGEESKKKINILFLLLKPTQYRHIISYLKHLYGEEKVSGILDKIKKK